MKTKSFVIYTEHEIKKGDEITVYGERGVITNIATVQPYNSRKIKITGTFKVQKGETE